jgi:hypothetical protein
MAIERSSHVHREVFHYHAPRPGFNNLLSSLSSVLFSNHNLDIEEKACDDLSLYDMHARFSQMVKQPKVATRATK